MAEEGTGTGMTPRSPSPAGFFASRWAGDARVDVLIWRDMLVVGTTINLVTSFAALMALGFKAPVWLAALIYLSPLPYNLFLVLALWRCIERQGTKHAGTLRIGSLLWLVVVTLI